MSSKLVSSASNEFSVSSNNSDEKFDIQLVYDSFAKCCENIDAISMDHYLTGFKELYRFFSLLGSVFGFVASDIISKVNILEEYQRSENAHEYSTVQSMVEYESSSGKTADTNQPSGSRTLLRLHRSLEFVMSFMRDVSMAESDSKTSTIAQKCYKETLSKHHPWLIQKGAYFAMYTLPARQQFIERVSGGPCDLCTVQHYEKVMGDIGDVLRKVYDQTHKLYEANNLLDLP